MITNKMSLVQLKMKFEPIFFQVLWQFFNPKGSLLRAGGRGVWGEFRPPYKFWAKSVRIFSNAHRQYIRRINKEIKTTLAISPLPKQNNKYTGNRLSLKI